jgi:hypothetical protein
MDHREAGLAEHPDQRGIVRRECDANPGSFEAALALYSSVSEGFRDVSDMFQTCFGKVRKCFRKFQKCFG